MTKYIRDKRFPLPDGEPIPPRSKVTPYAGGGFWRGPDGKYRALSWAEYQDRWDAQEAGVPFAEPDAPDPEGVPEDIPQGHPEDAPDEMPEDAPEVEAVEAPVEPVADGAAVGAPAKAIPDQVRDDERGGDDEQPDDEPADDELADDEEEGRPSLDELVEACSKMPEPAGRRRHDGWSRRKMALFLRELAASQSVSQAARSVGMSRQSAYDLRNRLGGTPFALGWEVALEAGLQQLAHSLMERALHGEEVQHYYHGELVGTSRRHDNRLAIWLMQNPWKVGRHQIAREYVAPAFERLLERIEFDSLDWDWDAGEQLPGPPLSQDEIEEAELLEYDPDLDGDPDPDETALDREERICRTAIERRQNHFVSRGSWYGGNVGLPASRSQTGGRYGGNLGKRGG